MGRGAGLIFMFSFLYLNMHAAGELPAAGARASGMGYAVTAINDGWSGFNNQAGLGWQQSFCVGAYFENRFLVKELSLEAVGAVFPVKSGALGITFRHFGYSLYSEITAGAAYGMRLGDKFSLGISLDYLRIHFGEDYGSKNLVTFEVGAQFRPGQRICLGAHLSNPYPVKLTDYPDERLPVRISFGIAWLPSNVFTGAADIEMDLGGKPVLKTGLEYHLVKPLFLRIGYMTTPSRFTFGTGFEFGKFCFDVSAQYHSVLGFSPQVSLSYTLEN